jgi:hypothetical protein
VIQSLILKTVSFLSRGRARPIEVTTFPADWLVRQISIQQAEDHEEVLGLNGWNTLKAAIQPGDDIWIFCSPPKTWNALMGRRGIVLLREGKEIAKVVTVMN